MTTAYRFDPHQQISEIVLVGLGGTGSQWARSIARVVYHLGRQRQHTPAIRFVDPDRVEAKNVGRQMFSEAQIGQYKAEALATCFNYAMGLGITWHNEPFDAERHVSRYGTLLCGAVDNHLARYELAKAHAIWIDAGNHFSSGQVTIGNSNDPQEVWRGFGEQTSRWLPHATLLFPSLLEPEPEPLPQPASCADLVERGDQHLLVNDTMGIIAADYTYRLLTSQPITSFLTYVDTSSAFTARSVPITREELVAYLGEPGRDDRRKPR